MKRYFVYIAGSYSGTLYVGVTNDIVRRIYEHQQGIAPGFSSKYGISRLLYLEETTDIRSAIAREKQIKRWRRDKKEKLIRIQNPKWLDLKRDSSTRFARSE